MHVLAHFSVVGQNRKQPHLVSHRIKATIFAYDDWFFEI